MKVNILTLTNLRMMEETIRASINNLHKELSAVRGIVMQLQDRIQIIEHKMEGKHENIRLH